MAKNNDYGVHMTHCNMGEYIGSCKYGEDETCPALHKDIKLTSKQQEVVKAMRSGADLIANFYGDLHLFLAGGYTVKVRRVTVQKLVDNRIIYRSNGLAPHSEYSLTKAGNTINID